jgi:hypothetical protein
VMKNYEFLAEALLASRGRYDDLAYVADYIDCPSEKDCDYDGQDGTCCVECKTRWLQKEWDE